MVTTQTHHPIWAEIGTILPNRVVIGWSLGGQKPDFRKNARTRARRGLRRMRLRSPGLNDQEPKTGKEQEPISSPKIVQRSIGCAAIRRPKTLAQQQPTKSKIDCSEYRTELADASELVLDRQWSTDRQASFTWRSMLKQK